MARVGLVGGVTVASVGAVGLIGLRSARAVVARIELNPDPFPRDVLARELQGEEALISRPDGTVLRAVAAGDGPPVVPAHGFGVTVVSWNIVWDLLLARGHRVIAFDQRGHGRSTLGSDGIGSAPMAADYAAVLEHFDVRDGVLVGHSMGGFVAIRAVLDHLDIACRLRGLVLFAAFAGDVLAGAPQNWLQLPLLQFGILRRLVQTRTGGTLFGAAQCGTTPSPAMIAVFRDVFTRQNLKPLIPILHAAMRENRYPRLGEISVPTVVMVGSADRTTPPGHGQRLTAGIPGARLVTVPDAGHMLNWETEGPSTLVDVIDSFQPQPAPTTP
jgi:non-heme chloroperoxidase